MKAIGMTLGILALMGIAYYSGYSAGTAKTNADRPVAAHPSGPDPERVYEVATGSSPALGAEDAAVVIVEFSDFQCPYCAKVAPTLHRVQEAFPGQVRIVFKHNPLPFHERALPAHKAALAARMQGKFWEMHDRIFADPRTLDPEGLKAHAQALGLDVAAFEAAMGSQEVADAIEADLAQSRDLGVQGTPSFFINGRFVAGNLPFEAFEERIESELAAGRS